MWRTRTVRASEDGAVGVGQGEVERPLEAAKDGLGRRLEGEGGDGGAGLGGGRRKLPTGEFTFDDRHDGLLFY
jgi:hypothetical protein